MLLLSRKSCKCDGNIILCFFVILLQRSDQCFVELENLLDRSMLATVAYLVQSEILVPENCRSANGNQVNTHNLILGARVQRQQRMKCTGGNSSTHRQELSQ